MRECWVIEEQDKKTDAWRAVMTFVGQPPAEETRRRWYSEYTHRVVRYVPADTVAQVAAPPQEDRKP